MLVAAQSMLPSPLGYEECAIQLMNWITISFQHPLSDNFTAINMPENHRNNFVKNQRDGPLFSKLFRGFTA